MKKLIPFFTFCFLMFVLCFVSCGYDSVITEQETSNIQTNTPKTTCYVNGLETRLASSVESPIYNIEDAYFYIRVDNRIPGSGSYPVSQYYPKSNRGSVKASYNKGSINVNYVGWSTSTSDPIKYVYDTTGKTSVLPIFTEPDLSKLLSNSGVKLNTDTLKVIWYITKYESGFWHVDGVLTGKSTKDVTEVPGIDEDKSKENQKEVDTIPALTDSIEVDIHQQEHQTWDEIKTSVHIRDLVDSIKISIPIESKYVCESDDMAIRYYEYFGTAEQSSSYVQLQVNHTSSSIDITIKVNPNYVKELIDKDGDGLTVEIHNYIKDLTKEEMYNLLKKSTVVTYKETTITGQITSAFFDDKIYFKK